MTKNLEIKTIEHKGITVSIKIDYDTGKATLVEADMDGKYKRKQWIFAERGLEYMSSWENILEAMQVAVKECKKELEFSLAQSSRIKEEKIVDALIRSEVK